MQKNSMQRFFKNIKITYDDLPYLYIPLFVATGIIFAAWLKWGITAVIWGIFILSTYLILATQFHLYRSTKKDLENHQKKIQAYFSLYSMVNFRESLPYMTGWSATPELALAIYQEIRNNQPDKVFELGSGISTVIASYGLEQNGKGTITSLDHDSTYANKSRDLLKSHKVDAFAQIKICPLVPYEIENTTWHWYDLESLSFTEEINMLLIDGPPVKTNKNARFPALPLLIDKLSDHATIIVHDAHRPSERDILSRWITKFPEFSCEIKNTEKGIAVLRR